MLMRFTTVRLTAGTFHNYDLRVFVSVGMLDFRVCLSSGLVTVFGAEISSFSSERT